MPTRRKYHLIFDKGGKEEPLRVSFSPWVLWIILSLFLSFIGYALFSIFRGIPYEVNKKLLIKLKQENKILASKYKEIKLTLDSLRNIFENLSKEDIKLRVLVGIEPVPKDIREFGTGGGIKKDVTIEKLRKIKSPRVKDIKVIKEELARLKNAARFQRESFEKLKNFIKEKEYILDRTPSIPPCKGVLLSGFGYRIDPFTKMIKMHEGIDIGGPIGTPIVSTADGIVSYTGVQQGYGLCVKINHGSGIETFYAHLSAILVKPGQPIRRGQVIGLLGNTGRSTGPHLHYEVRIGGKAVNPMYFMIESPVIVD